MSEFKVGDLVNVDDDSWAIRVDEYDDENGIHGCYDSQVFVVVGVVVCRSAKVKSSDKSELHNIFIKNTGNGAIYLHSKSLLTYIEQPAVKEMTVADVEAMAGCKVKIVK